MINEHHHFRKYSDKDEQSKKKRLSIKVNKITYKLSVRTFMHHLTLLLEKVADLFPLRKPTSVIFQAIAYLNIATGTKKRSQ